ncbi:MAG TPA: 3-oxoacyl-ACP reductase family protein [Syntrophorhabdaceae bacterium]|jgi:NAD(P)-dependent dehydrogenase (short-subunit alcohol dehydrogenase family)
MKRLEGKVVIITGAGKGLGKAFALRFADEGARLALATRKDMEGLKGAAKEVIAKGAECIWFQADVTKPEDVRKMADETAARFGKIDVLVNNAAYYFGVERRPFNAIPMEEWDMMMNINVKGPWLCAQAVYPYMKAQGKGKIINLTSEVFFTGSNGFVHYVASKGGVVGLTRALAAELGPDNITVNGVAPGFTDTEASRTIADVTKYDVSKTPLRRLGVAQDIIGAALFFASDDADFVTGEILLVDGGRAMH